MTMTMILLPLLPHLTLRLPLSSLAPSEEADVEEDAEEDAVEPLPLLLLPVFLPELVPLLSLLPSSLLPPPPRPRLKRKKRKSITTTLHHPSRLLHLQSLFILLPLPLPPFPFILSRPLVDPLLLPLPSPSTLSWDRRVTTDLLRQATVPSQARDPTDPNLPLPRLVVEILEALPSQVRDPTDPNLLLPRLVVLLLQEVDPLLPPPTLPSPKSSVFVCVLPSFLIQPLSFLSSCSDRLRAEDVVSQGDPNQFYSGLEMIGQGFVFLFVCGWNEAIQSLC